MVVATKFEFGSWLCEGKILAPVTSVVINENHLVKFSNRMLAFVYLFSSNY